MARKLHLGPRFKFVLACEPLNGHNLIDLKHRFWQLIEITSTYYIDSGVHDANLDGLEIVREVHGCLNCVARHRLGLGVIQVESL